MSEREGNGKRQGKRTRQREGRKEGRRPGEEEEKRAGEAEGAVCLSTFASRDAPRASPSPRLLRAPPARNTETPSAKPTPNFPPPQASPTNFPRAESSTYSWRTPLSSTSPAPRGSSLRSLGWSFGWVGGGCLKRGGLFLRGRMRRVSPLSWGDTEGRQGG